MSNRNTKPTQYSTLSQVQKDQINARRRELYAQKKKLKTNKLKEGDEDEEVCPNITDEQVYNPSQNRSATIYEEGSCSTKSSVPKKKGSPLHNVTTGVPKPRKIPQKPFTLPTVPSCLQCHAKRFPYEPDGFCCCKGEVRLYENTIPESLVQLYTCQTPESIDFRKHIRAYNNAFSFTSFGVILDERYTTNNTGIYTFRAQGQVYHFLNSLYPSAEPPAYLQLYFFDTENEVENRREYAKNLQPKTIEKLIGVLSLNPYSLFFRSLREIEDLETHEIRLRADPKIDTQTLFMPTTSQVAAIWCENDTQSTSRERHIMVQQHDGHRQRIRYHFGCYDSLQYPLLFPMGEPGWHQGIEKIPKGQGDNALESEPQPSVLPSKPQSAESLLAAESLVFDENLSKRNMVSAREFYAYRFQIRPTINSILLHSGRLLQQFAVDMYVKIESSRLDYFRNKQDEIRAELYQGIVDSIAQGETNGSKIGKRIILPGTFIGGPRDMRKRYLDAMTLVERFGKPDVFLTMTCNPNWPEITKKLQNFEQVQNRPDLVTRIFRSKIEQLKKEVIKKELFGSVAAYTYVIEFQKRGLPHIHMLIILKRAYKLNSVDKFDAFISAELPDKQTNPSLYSMVIKHMMHGPCGDLNPTNVCMRNAKCTDTTVKCKDHYPRPFTNETKISTDGYPIYRRRDDNQEVKVRGKMLDNKWVVPYNPYLLAMFDCHINVEICSTIKAVKYLYKYMYKGYDKVVFRIEAQQKRDELDEISQFQTARWVSPPEAMWRIYRFSLHDMHPTVISLQLHLEDCQLVTFRNNKNITDITNADFFKRTMLTQFFEMNKDNDKAKKNKYLYKEFPTHFVWSKRDRVWTERKCQAVVGRIITANPTEGERYYLRLLLNHVRAPTSYIHLRTVNKIPYNTFREAALARGLLEDDKSNEKCLEEACMYQMPISLRQLFCTILVYCGPINPKQLFLTFEGPMIEDFTERQHMPKERARQCLLAVLGSTLESMGKKLQEFDLADLVLPVSGSTTVCKEILDEQNIAVPDADMDNITQLNSDQKRAYDEIMNAVNQNIHQSFFIDGPGGTGKTFLYRALLATVRSSNRIALATATSGVAASILPNGRTAHSRFKIPIDADDKLTCNVGKQTGLAKLFRATSLIIWDEASMAKKQTIEALDDMLRDITDVDYLFGGKVVVLGGDFRQVLPVIPKASKEECINASLVRSHVWPMLKRFKLQTNMRARLDPSFSSFLLRVGNGTEKSNDQQEIQIPMHMLIKHSPNIEATEQLINFVFPDLNEYANNALSMTNSAILTPKNNSVDEINERLLEIFPGEEEIYFSIDETVNRTEQGLYVDLLHSLSPAGLPPHKLVLKKNAPIMLLRNLNPAKGLCNGTRLIVRAFEKHSVIAQIAVGEHKGDFAFIPRIPLQPSDPKLYPVEFTRRQFPIRLCFAMTINKAQGQTLDTVGIYLPQPVFSHGQFYVGLSRATAADKIRVLLEKTPDNSQATQTKNIVYNEILIEAEKDN